MKAHPGLSREDVLKYGPAKMLLMVASEFWRAADLAGYPEKVEGCLQRAQELLGLVETIELPEVVALQLQPYLLRCRDEVLHRITRETPEAVREICQDYAQRFELMATLLPQGAPHA